MSRGYTTDNDFLPLLFSVMDSVTNIRPHIQPIALANALSGVEYDVVSGSIDLVEVTGVSVTTLDMEPGWLFIAMPGITQHGMKFASTATKLGAKAILTDIDGAKQGSQADLGVPIIAVKDPRSATAVVAANIYRHPAKYLTTAAITGTNGKTTTSYLVRAVLGARYNRVAMCGTNETVVGGLKIPAVRTTAEAPVVQRMMALALEDNGEAAVIETSAHALSLHRVDTIIFDIVGFTNLQHDHLDYYQDMAHYFDAKAALFTPAHAKRGVVCVDDEWGEKLAEQATIPITTVSVFSHRDADWRVSEISENPDTGYTSFRITEPSGVSYSVHCPIIGQVNAQNCAVAIAMGASLGIDTASAIKALENSDQVPGRMQVVNPNPGSQPMVVVDYAHTPEGLEWTLASVRPMVKGKIVLVFGTDGDRDASKREELAEVAAKTADVLWVTDENPRTEDPQKIRDYLLRGITRVRPNLENVYEVKTCRRDAIRKAILAADAGDMVLITGKGAESYQEIDGIRHTYNDVPVSREILVQEPRHAQA